MPHTDLKRTRDSQRPQRLSATMEDYTKAIYRLQQSSHGGVATNDVAAAMSVAASSATAMVKALAKLGIAEHTPYQGVRLTLAGERLALEVIRHHRLLERYLQEFLGFRWDEVHEEADRLEHAISERLEERLAELLGNPETDPHGDPIPARDGSLPAQSLIPVLSLPYDEPATVGRVSTSDPDKLRYLAALGLVPGASVTLRMIAPFGGPITLRCGDIEHNIGPELAMDILVSPENPAASGPERKEELGGRASE